MVACVPGCWCIHQCVPSAHCCHCQVLPSSRCRALSSAVWALCPWDLDVDCSGGHLIVPFPLCSSFVQSCFWCALSSHTVAAGELYRGQNLTLASTAHLLWSAAGRRVWPGVPAPMQSEGPAYLPSWALQDVGSAVELPVPQCWEFRTRTPYGIAGHAVWALCLQLPSQVLHCPSCPAHCPWKHIQFGNKLMFQSR